MLIEIALISGATGYWLKKKNQSVEQAARVAADVSQKHAVNAKKSLKKLYRDLQRSLFSEDRQALEMQLEPSKKKAADEKRKSIQNGILLSTSTVGMAILSTAYPLLRIPTIVGVLYLYRDIFGFLRRDFSKGHYLSAYLLNVIIVMGMIALGYVILAAIGAVLMFVLAKITKSAEAASKQQLFDVFAEHPSQVWVEQDGIEIQVDFQDIQVGTRVIVNAGEIIPVDGIVQAGGGYVDQHLLTGESEAVEQGVGDKVFAATLLLSGRMKILVETAGRSTVAAQIAQVLQTTQHYTDELMARGQKIADQYLPIELGLSAVTVFLLSPVAALSILWSGLGYRMIVYGPLSVLNYLQIMSRQGVLIKDGRVLESLRTVDTVVFDKTGTLTLEQPLLAHIHVCGGYDANSLLAYAAAAEYRQTHPIAQAILQAANKRGLVLPQHEGASYEVGYGIKVQLDGKQIYLGSRRFMLRENLKLPNNVEDIQSFAEALGHSLVFIGIDDCVVGVLEMQPQLRPEVPAMVQALRQRGIEMIIISGDHENPTRNLAIQLGIKNYFAETLPEHKADIVQQLRAAGKFVCFIGDGINDAIALKSAHISISLKGASTAAMDTAQIVLMDGTLNAVEKLLQLSDEFEDTMQSSFLYSMAPGIINIAGVYLLHFSLAGSVFIYYAGTLAGLLNTLQPLVKYQEPEENQMLLLTHE